MARNYLRRALGIAAFVAILALVCTTAAFANPSKGASDNPSGFACDVSFDETPITDDQGTDDSASASDDESDASDTAGSDESADVADSADDPALADDDQSDASDTDGSDESADDPALADDDQSDASDTAGSDESADDPALADDDQSDASDTAGSDESADDPRWQTTISPTLATPMAATSRPTWPTARTTARRRATSRPAWTTAPASTPPTRAGTGLRTCPCSAGRATNRLVGGKWNDSCLDVPATTDCAAVRQRLAQRRGRKSQALGRGRNDMLRGVPATTCLTAATGTTC